MRDNVSMGEDRKRKKVRLIEKEILKERIKCEKKENFKEDHGRKWT